MTRNKQSATVFILLFLASFYGWLWFYTDNTWMKVFGASLFPMIGAAISIYWFIRPYRILTIKHRIFIILMKIGLSLHFLSSFIWLVNLLIHGDTDYPAVSFIIRITEYMFYFIALLYKLKLLYKSLSMGPFLFNILIFMIAAISISYYYLIDPIIKLSSDYQSIVPVFVLFPILDIGIAFLSIYIFYMTRYTEEYKTFLFLTLGFFTQIIADTLYLYLLVSGLFETGTIVYPLWLLAILLIGFCNFYVEVYEVEKKWHSNSFLNQRDSGLLLNLSVIYLAFIVLQSTGWDWNALKIGLFLSIIVIVIRQISIMKKHRMLLHNLWYHAYHDKLTGLFNRASYLKDIESLITFAQENQRKFAIMLLDFDRFKNVNDTLGHGIGDQLLQEGSVRLKQSISTSDRVYRVGGDEFIIILQDATVDYCKEVATTILESFSRALTVGIYQISITPSIGISMYPENGTTYETLLKNADTSMYLAKSKGRNQFEMYSAELNQEIARKMQLENELAQAVSKNEFILHYQPKVDLQTGKIIGAEALLRWEHPTFGVIPPDEFIPLAEETGQVVSIGNWVLFHACKQLIEWQNNGFHHLTMSVNVSVRQFQHKDFLNGVKKVLEETEVNPRALELEITESIMQNIEDSTRILNELRKIGINISIDDFGTGYSSLSVLKSLPIDTIKIDRTFITDLSKTDIAMVKTIMNIGLNLQLKVVIEGVETEEQLTTLLEISNQDVFGQGYLFGKPVTAKEFEKTLN